MTTHTERRTLDEQPDDSGHVRRLRSILITIDDALTDADAHVVFDTIATAALDILAGDFDLSGGAELRTVTSHD